MRRALLKQWPAFSRIYGLHPWDVDRLTKGELLEYDDDLKRLVKESNGR